MYWNRLNVITVTQRWSRDVQGVLRTNEPNRARCDERLSNKIRWCGKFFSTFGPNPIHELSGLTIIFRAQVTLTVSGGRDR
jgi:hypothetical protein